MRRYFWDKLFSKSNCILGVTRNFVFRTSYFVKFAKPPLFHKSANVHIRFSTPPQVYIRIRKIMSRHHKMDRHFLLFSKPAYILYPCEYDHYQPFRRHCRHTATNFGPSNLDLIFGVALPRSLLLGAPISGVFSKHPPSCNPKLPSFH